MSYATSPWQCFGKVSGKLCQSWTWLNFECSRRGFMKQEMLYKNISRNVDTWFWRKGGGFIPPLYRQQRPVPHQWEILPIPLNFCNYFSHPFMILASLWPFLCLPRSYNYLGPKYAFADDFKKKRFILDLFSQLSEQSAAVALRDGDEAKWMTRLTLSTWIGMRCPICNLYHSSKAAKWSNKAVNLNRAQCLSLCHVKDRKSVV